MPHLYPTSRLISISLFLLAGLTGCRDNTTSLIPAELEPYVTEFFIEANARGMDIDVDDYTLVFAWEDLSREEAVGLCYNRRRHVIKLDWNYWQRIDDCERRRVMFHELGHCVLDRGHRSEANELNLCRSIMNDPREENCVRGWYAEPYRSYYLDELFGVDADENLWNKKYTSIETTEEEPLFALVDTFITSDILDDRLQRVGIALPRVDNYRITVDDITFEDGVNPLYSIRVGEVSFQYCICAGGYITIRKFAQQGCSIYDSGSRDPGMLRSITIDVAEGLVSFYYNGAFVYAFAENELGREGERLLWLAPRSSVSTVRYYVLD